MHGYLSSLASNPANGTAAGGPSVSQSMVFYDKSRHHEQEVHDLKKECRRKEIEADKAKAILQQKVELLELQLKESHEREENIKKMHETLMNALQGGDSPSSAGLKTTRELEIASQMHKRDLQDLKSDHDLQLKDLKYQLSTKDSRLKEHEVQIESLHIEVQRRQQELELDRREQENRVKRYELERAQMQEERENLRNQIGEVQKQMNEKERAMCQAAENHAIQMQKMNDIVEQAKKEIDALKVQLRETDSEIQAMLQKQIREMQEKYLKEVDDLHNQVYDQQKRHREELLSLSKERDELRERKDKVEKQLDKLKSAPKPVTIHLSEENFATSRSTQQTQQRLNEENDYLTSQVTKLTNQVKTLREEVSLLQESELSLKRLLSQTQAQSEENRENTDRARREERRRLLSDLEQVTSERDRLQRVCMEKDSLIDDLRKDQSTLMMGHQSPIALGKNMNISMISASRDFLALAGGSTSNVRGGQRSVSPITMTNYQTRHHIQERSIQLLNKLSPSPAASGKHLNSLHRAKTSNYQDLPLQSQHLGTTLAASQLNPLQTHQHRITNTELKLYESCQKMVDAAIQMQCAQCSQLLHTTVFYDHIVSQQSGCGQAAALQQNQNTSGMYQTQQRSNNEDFTMCIGGVEESMMLNGYQSSSKIGKLTKGLNQSKDFRPIPVPKGKDKFAMTHCSSDFRMLKGQASQKSLQSFIKDSSVERPMPQKQKKMFKQQQMQQQQNSFNSQQQNVTVRARNGQGVDRDELIKQAVKKKLNLNLEEINKKTTQDLMLETPSSYDEGCDGAGTESVPGMDTNRGFESTSNFYGTVDVGKALAGVNVGFNSEGFVSSRTQTNRHQNNNYDNENVQEEDYEEDSASKERRIRRAQDLNDQDVGEEGNKSTYLRPSRNKSAVNLSVQSLKKEKKQQVKQQIKKHKKNKENLGGLTIQQQQQKQFQQLNTCRNPNNPMTFRQHDGNSHYMNSNVAQDKDDQVPNSKLKLQKNRYVQDSYKAFQKVGTGAPYTSKKSGNRYNALLRCSSSNGKQQLSQSSHSSYVSPRNLMFQGKKAWHDSEGEIRETQSPSLQQDSLSSNYHPHQIPQDQVHHPIQTQSSNGFILGSDLVSPSNYYYSNELQQQCREFENNENELLKLDQKHYLQQQKPSLAGGLELLSEDDLDFFNGNVLKPQTLVFTNQPQSSRHFGTHELVPSLIAQQENKYQTMNSQNGLVVYESSGQSHKQHHDDMESLQYKLSEEQLQNQQFYQTNGSSASNVVIETKRGTQDGNQTSTINSGRSHPRSHDKPVVYNSTQNLQRTLQKEKQLYVIRESCPSPLGEDDIIDDLGCPFDQLSQTNNQSMAGLLTSKTPHLHQDQVVHILPKPKFIQTLPMIRMRSITQMNVPSQIQDMYHSEAVEKVIEKKRRK